ncbi:unnamed protein product [Diplocarpon coronariae]|uniref:Uncharacterized protein n=1 Tax=Diplocarpon coronariae TaxID=2795749 RepID=A0A218Z6A6_9HELO|nr:hypothetical protein B2J93_84 [Marssonina coronariae]
MARRTVDAALEAEQKDDVIELGKAPVRNKARPVDFLNPTRYAPTYRSVFTRLPENAAIVPQIKHVNCSYLSTRGIVPNLLDLKKHAQALTILIKHITVSSQAGIIDNENSGVAGAFSFNDGETYDFLNDLSKEYDGPSNPNYLPSHLRPLTSLANVLQQQIQQGTSQTLPDGSHHVIPDRAWVEDICPLHDAADTGVTGPGLPYATLQTLISHANDVLERLDHEFSAKGGLLAILPSKEDDKEARALAETTLLGQMILYIQRLVQRLHDLERLYANSMDALAGEAVVPRQALSALGPDGRAGRELVYPQDRFVLVNAGEDVWQYLSRTFDQQDVIEEAVAKNWQRLGVAGEALFREQSSGNEYMRGITAIDITTRYYRLRQDPLKTIFVIPAHDSHPGTAATRKMEREPTVVSVVKPVWPPRASQWEMKHKEELHQARQDRTTLSNMHFMVDRLEAQRHILEGTRQTQAAKIRSLEDDIRALRQDIANSPDQNLRRRQEDASRIVRERSNFDAREAKLIADEADLQIQKTAHAQQQADLEAAQQEWNVRRNAADKAYDDLNARKAASLAARDAELAETQQALQDKLIAVWRKQIEKVNALRKHLEKKQRWIDKDGKVDPRPGGLTDDQFEALVADTLTDAERNKLFPLTKKSDPPEDVMDLTR